MTTRRPPAGPLGRLGDWSFRRRWLVVAGWIAALAIAVLALMPLAGESNVDFGSPGSDSAAAAALIESRFSDRSAETIDVVWRAEEGAGSPEARERIGTLLREASTLEGMGPATPAEISPDGRIGVARIQVDDAGLSTDTVVGSAERLIELAEAGSGPGLQIELGGDYISEAQGEGASPEAIGMALAGVILLLTFGSLLAAGLPLLTALFGLGIGASLIGLMAAVMDVPDFATPVAAMIGIGVGIDYALLVVTRFRAGLAEGLSPRQAITGASATAGRSVVVAGLTVVIAVMGLATLGLPEMTAVALSASLAVLLSVLASLTLLPAILGLLGRRVDLLRIPGLGRPRRGGRPSRWVAWSGVVQRRPWAALAAGLAIVVVLAAPVTTLRLGFPDAGNDPASTTTRQAYDLAAEGFGPGANGPLIVAAELPGGDGAAVAAQLRERIAETGGVASVSEPRLNPARDTAVLTVASTHSPQAEETADLVHRLRDRTLPPLEARTGASVHIGGATAATIDSSDYMQSRLPILVGSVIGLSFLLLMAAFRSLPVALKAAVMNLLSIGAAYGVIALVAQGGWAGQLVGIDTEVPVPSFAPVMMFAILFGLSMDYEVFLLSRIRERYLVHGDTPRAVSEGLAGTARVITAAAAIMIAVFAAFATTSAVFLKLIGIGLAAAILVDVTVVRILLAPAAMQILGRANWWLPGWIDRLLPRLRVEREGPRRSAAPAE